MAMAENESSERKGEGTMDSPCKVHIHIHLKALQPCSATGQWVSECKW